MHESTHTKVTMFGGAASSFLANVNGSDMVKTIVMTAIGAIVSFYISQGLRSIPAVLKKMVRWLKRTLK